MATINKEIIINAPPQKIFSYLTKPSNLPQIWPSVVEIKNEQLLPNGVTVPNGHTKWPEGIWREQVKLLI